MAEITILHISDLHFGIPDDGSYYSKNRALVVDSFLDSFDVLLKGNNGGDFYPDVIVITGDIGWSGDSADYNDLNGDNGFLNRLLKVTNVDKENVFVCPGNHDKQLPQEYNGINFRADIESSRIGCEVKKYTMFFRNYAVAMETLGISSYLNKDNENDFLYGYRVINISGKHLCFIAQNTAWLCDYREDYKEESVAIKDEKNLSIAPELVEKIVRKVSSLEPQSDAVITLFHHPKDWLKETETVYEKTKGPKLAFDRLMEKTDIVCCGHKHQDQRECGQNYVVFAAGTISSNDTRNASCNIIKLIFDEKTPEKKVQSYTFDATWYDDGDAVKWSISGPGSAKRINRDEMERYYEQRHKEDKDEISKLKERNKELEAEISKQKEQGKDSQSLKTVSALIDKTKEFTNNVDKYIGGDLSNEQKSQEIEILKDAFTETIKRMTANDLNALIICNNFLSTLKIDCSEQAKQLCQQVFKSVLELLDKQNSENNSLGRILKPNPDGRIGGSDKQ